MDNSKTVVNIEISGNKMHVEKLGGDPEDLFYILTFLVKKISIDTDIDCSIITDSIKENLGKESIKFAEMDGDTH